MAALVLLAACGETPQPFRHETVSELAKPRLVRAVAVRPVDGLPAGAALAEALVQALGERDIPALVRDSVPGGRLLEGRLEGPQGAQVVAWTLHATDGATEMEFRQALPAAAWRDEPPKAFRAQAEQAVANLTAIDPPAPSSPPAAAHRPTARILAPGKLPGDGAAALVRSLRAALERNGILVVGTGGDYVVEGKVAITPGRLGEENLKVSWVVSGADGGQLGAIDQQGAVAKGALDGAWGGLARDIAEGGAAGIVQVLEAASRAASQGPAALQNR